MITYVNCCRLTYKSRCHLAYTSFNIIVVITCPRSRCHPCSNNYLICFNIATKDNEIKRNFLKKEKY